MEAGEGGTSEKRGRFSFLLVQTGGADDLLASPWKPNEERVGEETRLVTCTLYHLYTAPLNLNPFLRPITLLSLILFLLDDCGKPQFESRQTLGQQADDLSSCLSACQRDRQSEHGVGWRRSNNLF